MFRPKFRPSTGDITTTRKVTLSRGLPFTTLIKSEIIIFITKYNEIFKLGSVSIDKWISV